MIERQPHRAIAHDQIVAHGGAEKVAFEMARLFDAPIYAGVVDQSVVPDDVEAHEVFDGPVQSRLMDSHHMVQDAYQMFGWQDVSELNEFDTIILNKTNPAWYVPTDRQTTVQYAHSTPRGLYDKFQHESQSFVSKVMKTGMRTLYEQNIMRPDAWACNSELVARRLTRYWDIPQPDIDVVYPPVDVESYPVNDGGEYYFTWSRLVDHKQIGEIVTAFQHLGDDYHLIVGGDGPQRDALEEQAPANVDIIGYMSETKKRELLEDAKAVIFNATNEDFGLVPVEAMASGTPVIGVQDGYTEFQILDGKNGLTFGRESGRLAGTVAEFERNGVEWSAEDIAQWAVRYDIDEFRQGLEHVVRTAEREAAVEPWADEPTVTSHPVRADGGDENGE